MGVMTIARLGLNVKVKVNGAQKNELRVHELVTALMQSVYLLSVRPFVTTLYFKSTNF